MIPEIGHFLLWMGLGVALVLGVVPMAGAARANVAWMSLARPSAYLLFGLVVTSFICLATSFVQHDFSVLYVASNSNSALPLQYRIAAMRVRCCCGC
jgi:cytochrome c-type biogenesis protein CcmF